jgi:ribosome recycling factor
MAEASRVAVRNARRDGNKDVDKLQKGGEVPEDDAQRGKDQIQEMTKKYETQIEEGLDAKVHEIQET